MTPNFSAIILAAGEGTRMKSANPKILHKIGGRSLIHHVLASLEPLKPENITIVLAPSMKELESHLTPHRVVYQDRALGTAHAVKSAETSTKASQGDIAILFGDTPFIETGTIKRLLARRKEQDNPALVLLGMRPTSPKGYGRYITDNDGYLLNIVEERDATESQRQIGLCNGGVMLVDREFLWSGLKEIQANNVKGEYYLTDLVAIAVRKNRKVAYLEVSETEILGINDRQELANAEMVFQRKKRKEILDKGVTLINPETIYFSADTDIAQDCIIGPSVFFGPGVRLQGNVEVRAFSHLEGVEIKKNAQIGPFARLRPGTIVGENAHIGNFVEVKNSIIGNGAKANHLSYLGDAKVGERANIGAGTITCNYDGFQKSTTEIGADVFIGSNSALIAPVTIGKGAIIGAGSVITENVKEDSLALARAKQEEKPGWAAKFREWRKK